MALRSLLYILMALGVAGFLGAAWIAMRPPVPLPPVAAAMVAAPLPPPRPHVIVLTAARPLRAGALLAADDIAAREVETGAPDMLVDAPATRDALLGGMIRHNLPTGTLLHTENVLRPNDRGFLAAVLEPGMRAVSIGVDAISGVAGLVWPGDRVDLVLTQAIDDATQPAGRRISGETMLAGLRVVAIDQQLMQGALGAEGAERNVRTVTLEVTSGQAERIAVGVRLGRLSLAVHAILADAPPSAIQPGAPRVKPGVTWAGDVSSALAGAKAAASMRVYRGPDKSEEMHF